MFIGISTKIRDRERLTAKRWKKLEQPDTYQNKTGIAVLILDTVDYRARCITRNKENIEIMIKHLVQEEVMILNLCVTNKNFKMCFEFLKIRTEYKEK